MTSLLSALRYLQGERPGLHAGREHPAPIVGELASLLPSIQIQTAVRLADVSYYQEEIAFPIMRAAGIAGTIIRAGQRNWVDIRFKENWRKAKEAGLPRGSYWLFDSREDPRKQAALWASLVRDEPGELVHVADLEENYGGPYGTKAHFKEFLLEFQRLTGLPDDRVAIYTGHFWWMERVGNDPFFARYALWLAWYASMSVVRVPAPWDESDLLFWQYTSSGNGTAYGVSSLEIDLNYYCCDLAAFHKRFPLTFEGDPPMPEIDYVYSITPDYSDGNLVRTEPDTGNNTPVAKLAYGKLAYGNRKLTIAEDKYEIVNGVNKKVNQADDIWLEVLEVDGQLLPRPAYIAGIHLGNQVATIKQIGTLPDPVTTLPDLPYTVTLGDDVTYAKATISGVLKPK